VLLPRYWRFVKQLPMSAQGKLTSAAVHALFSPEDNHHAVT
jgi:acyl-coenzyme A synthetase/AMP-(fatty) acid ligase